jgi:glycolate oxidase iron-sulfur subunit
MQTNFTPEQLQDPHIADANGVIRKCVHCGFCTATCPTYVLLGDELDSPRGRIYLIKNMLENGEAATAETVKHVDRCLSCLACMSTCPSGVNYMHLIDGARVHIEKTYDRPLFQRLLRHVLAFVMPRPKIFRPLMLLAGLARPLGPVFERFGLGQLAAGLALVPKRIQPQEPLGVVGDYGAVGQKRGRVALLQGCVQSILEPDINAATIRLLTRLGYEVNVSSSACCGSLTHHMGKEAPALSSARHLIDAWTRAEVDAVIITASGCGTTIKDYGHMLRLDPDYATKAAVISAKAKDITEFLSGIALPKLSTDLHVAYHSACSMQHGQKLKTQPIHLLRQAGFRVSEVPEGHLCCGSAGTYNILQPEIAGKLKDRKIANIESLKPDLIATGNIGCIIQIATGTGIPIVHTIELLDWASGGPMPVKLLPLMSEKK